MKTMLLTKLKPIVAGILVLGFIGFGGLISQDIVVGQQVPNDQREGESPIEARPTPKVLKETPSATAANKELEEADKRSATVTYAVADLVIPIPDLRFPASKEKEVQTQEAWLIGMITRSISPSSWEAEGGPGTIDYSPTNHALVVNNTASVHAQIQRLLETMRRVQSVQIVTEIKTLTLSAKSFRKLRELLPQLRNDEHAVLSKAEAFALVHKASEEKDTNVVSAPKVVFFPGQSVNISIDAPDNQKTTLKLHGYVAANLRSIEFDLKATLNKIQFAQALQIEDGKTLVQARANGDGYAIVLATPRVVIANDEPDPPAAKKERK